MYLVALYDKFVHEGRNGGFLYGSSLSEGDPKLSCEETTLIGRAEVVGNSMLSMLRSLNL